MSGASVVSRVAVIVLGALLLVQCGESARAGRAGLEIGETVLENGLRVVVVTDSRSPVVTHMLWYLAGSADDPPGQSGVAHFLEHLMFAGTSRNPQGAFNDAVNAVGGMQNAFTSFDYSVYFQRVIPDALEQMMQFEADRMRNLEMTERAVEIERDVVAEERRVQIDNDPASLMVEEMDATLFQRHPYRNPVIGWMHEIEALDRGDAIAFYNRYYQPDNAILVVIGDVIFDRTVEMAQAAYGSIPRGPIVAPRERPREPKVNTRRQVELRDARVGAPKFRKTWVVPSYARAEPKTAEALALLAEILGGSTHSRIYQKEVVESGAAKSVAVRFDGHGLDYGYFSLYGTPLGGERLEALEMSFDAEIASVAAKGVSAEELDTARRRYLWSQFFANDDQMNFARHIGMVLATGGSIDQITKETARLEAVTPEDIQRVAQEWLVPSRAVTGYLLGVEDVGQ